MKTEKLKEWGLDERQIGMVMRENGLDIEAVKAKFSGYEALKERAAQLEKAAASAEEVQRWREKAEETEKNWRQKWEKRDFEEALGRSLRQAGARSERAVRALLREQELSLEKDGTIKGLKEQLSADPVRMRLFVWAGSATAQNHTPRKPGERRSGRWAGAENHGAAGFCAGKG